MASGKSDIYTIDNGGRGNARYTAYKGRAGSPVGYGATKNAAIADLQVKLAVRRASAREIHKGELDAARRSAELERAAPKEAWVRADKAHRRVVVDTRGAFARSLRDAAMRALRSGGFGITEPTFSQFDFPNRIEIRPDAEGLARCATLVRDNLQGHGFKATLLKSS